MMRVALLHPHTHAGREYPPGAEIDLSDADAAWLVSLKKARPADEAEPETESTDKESQT